jgi:hypothetical protein
MLINRYVCIAFQLVCKHGGGWNGAVFVLVRVGTCWYILVRGNTGSKTADTELSVAV